MISKKKKLAVAKTMFKQSLNEKGFIDPKKVNRVLREISSLKPAGLVNILKTYRRLVEEKIRLEEITVEAGTKVSNQKKVKEELISRSGARVAKFKINPSIVFGARITHGDWIFDSNLPAKLKQLTQNL